MDLKLVFFVVIFLVGLTNIEAGRRGGGGGRRGGSGISISRIFFISGRLGGIFRLFFFCKSISRIFSYQVDLEALEATKILDLLGQFLVEAKRRTKILNLPTQNNSITMLEEQILIIEIILEAVVGIIITGILELEIPIIEADMVETGIKIYSVIHIIP